MFEARYVHVNRLLATGLIAAITATGGALHADSPTAKPGMAMIDTIGKICEFVTERKRNAVAVAQRFGMHLHDYGGSANITFTPRDREFTEGSSGRKWESQEVNDVDLVVAPSATLTLGQLRAAFGTQIGTGQVPQHAGPGISFAFSVDAHPESPMDCAVNVEAIGDVSLTAPPDDVRVRKVTIVPGPRLGPPKRQPAP